LSWFAVIGSIERRNWSRAFIAFLALLLTGAYSVTAPLGSEQCRKRSPDRMAVGEIVT